MATPSSNNEKLENHQFSLRAALTFKKKHQQHHNNMPRLSSQQSFGSYESLESDNNNSSSSLSLAVVKSENTKPNQQGDGNICRFSLINIVRLCFYSIVVICSCSVAVLVHTAPRYGFLLRKSQPNEQQQQQQQQPAVTATTTTTKKKSKKQKPLVINTAYHNIEEDKARVWTQLTFSAEYDQELMPHAIQHYLDMGASPNSMLITLHHLLPNASALQQAEQVVRQQFGIQHVQTWSGNFTSQKNNDMRRQHRQTAGVDDCDWILKFDADELLRVPGNDIYSFLEFTGQQHFDSVHATWVDRIAPQGHLPNISASPSIAEQFPVHCQDFSHQAGDNATNHKTVAFRGYHNEKRSGHSLLTKKHECRYPVQLYLDHYKWTHPVVQKLQRRMDFYKNVAGINWWTESAAFLKHIEDNDGRLDITKPEYKCTDYSSTTTTTSVRQEGEQQQQQAEKKEEGKHQHQQRQLHSTSSNINIPLVHSFYKVDDDQDSDKVVENCQKPPTCPARLVWH